MELHGTADEAKAMLTKAVAALKADKAKTLDTINKGEGGSPLPLATLMQSNCLARTPGP